MDARALSLLAAASFGLVGVAGAQETEPTDVELRSAYCIAVLNADINLTDKLIANSDASVKSAPTPELRQLDLKMNSDLRDGLAKFESALNRLKLYLLPRMVSRDPIAITAAMNRGQADIHEVMAMADRCGAKCARPGQTPDQIAACDTSCFDKDLMARVEACVSPIWLPF